MTKPRSTAKKRAPASPKATRAAAERAGSFKLGAAIEASLGKVAKKATTAKSSGVAPTGVARERDAKETLRETDATAQRERLRFAQLMRGVKPLRDGSRRVPTTLEGLDDALAPAQSGKSRGGASEEAVERSAREKLEAFVAEGIRFEVVDDGESLEGRRLDVDPREIRKLRQLRYALDGTLDLHGLGAAEAREKLEGFLRRRRLQGDRAVLIVHGKGKHSPRAYAVLRGEIAAWLSQGRAQRDVAAFASVHDRDGGAGAVCVLLSR